MDLSNLVPKVKAPKLHVMSTTYIIKTPDFTTCLSISLILAFLSELNKISNYQKSPLGKIFSVFV